MRTARRERGQILARLQAGGNASGTVSLVAIKAAIEAA
jgi:hypothetical protein